ncbi:MAG: hypothetical protein JNK82_24645, partial [Myxococcaceae bacterium]|nr:hypothetical protein [Myxococcaceae bacterium]
MKRRLLVLLLCACGAPPPTPPSTTGKLDLNDVSWLYPLPATLDARAPLLQFTSAGPKGALFTRASFDQVKNVDEVLTAEQVYSEMRIISARVDPCFPTNKKDEPLVCAKQLRLI